MEQRSPPELAAFAGILLPLLFLRLPARQHASFSYVTVLHAGSTPCLLLHVAALDKLAVDRAVELLTAGAPLLT